MMLLIRKISFVVFMLVCSVASADVFIVKNIRVGGLQRISLGTVLSYLPVKEGDSIDDSQATDIIRSLYKTGFFADVTVQRSNNDLLIHVIERAVIGSITISGNSKITKKQMVEVLKHVDFTEGQALDYAALNTVKQFLTQQYYNLGLYDAKININIKPQERNRVAVTISIKEGPVAKIRSIKIVGNRVFKEKTLLKEFSLTTPKLWSFFTSSDQYSKEKLDADLEKLRTYYMDRGYLHINIDSTKVTITPDKKSIYITINITEGAVYKLAGFNLEGDLLGKQKELQQLIMLKVGDIFSRKSVMSAQMRINQFLGDYGYGMPDIKVDPDINETNKNVWIKFIVNPGHRIYIRHIDFKGNNKTNDEVLRREMRLQEGGLFSLSKLNESRRRLANLGYLQDIDYKTVQVTDSNNQVDLVYEVKETSAITANFQAGFSDKNGFIYGTSLTDRNFLGTGKSVSLGLDNSKASQLYSFGYHDPYFTDNGIGFSINGYLQKSTPGRVDLSPYSSNVYGVTASFDLPVTEYSIITFGLGIEHISINGLSNPSKQVKEFLDKYGSSFNQFKLISSWNYSNFDKAIFPTRGFAQTIGIEGYGPLDSKSLEFYKVNYETCFYLPLIKNFIFRTSTDIGYGNGIGKTKALPFFKNFFAGGIGSVRGYEAGSLGDNRDANNSNKSLGSNLLTVASASIIFPSPLKDSIRPSIFVDIGNVYSHGFKLKELRSSYGVQIEWRTPIAPLIFSLARPINKKPGDDLTMFQFSISGSI